MLVRKPSHPSNNPFSLLSRDTTSGEEEEDKSFIWPGRGHWMKYDFPFVRIQWIFVWDLCLAGSLVDWSWSPNRSILAQKETLLKYSRRYDHYEYLTRWAWRTVSCIFLFMALKVHLTAHWGYLGFALCPLFTLSNTHAWGVQMAQGFWFLICDCHFQWLFPLCGSNLAWLWVLQNPCLHHSWVYCHPEQRYLHLRCPWTNSDWLDSSAFPGNSRGTGCIILLRCIRCILDT